MGRGAVQKLGGRALAVITVLAASGCLFANNTAAGRAIHTAPNVLARAGSVRIQASFSSRLVAQGDLPDRPSPDGGLRLDGVVDFRSGRAAYRLPGGTGPAVVFDGKVRYALIPTAKPTDARPWVSVIADKKLHDFVLDPTAVPPSLAAFVLAPSLLVDTLAGALTGSIHRISGDGAPGDLGVPTIGYMTKVDIDQALLDANRQRYSQKAQDDLAKVFKVLGIKSGSLDSGAVWLDDQGNARRISLAISESFAYQNVVVLDVDLRLTPQTETASITVPNPAEVETVPSLDQYLLPLKSRVGPTR